jgi:hypothetical protein
MPACRGVHGKGLEARRRATFIEDQNAQSGFAA